MAALTESVLRKERDGYNVVLPVQANAKIYQGALLEAAADGAVFPATKGASKSYLGVAATAATGGDADGDVTVEVRRGRLFHFGIKSGDSLKAGANAYALDDNTVTVTSAGHSLVGKVIATDDDGAWVHID